MRSFSRSCDVRLRSDARVCVSRFSLRRGQGLRRPLETPTTETTTPESQHRAFWGPRTRRHGGTEKAAKPPGSFGFAQDFGSWLRRRENASRFWSTGALACVLPAGRTFARRKEFPGHQRNSARLFRLGFVLST